MNPTVITYIGLVVAAGIIVWSAVTIIQHARVREEKPPVALFDSWVIIRPLSSSDEEKELNPLLDVYLRGQESRFNSRSKKPR